jgi:short-subunit dehydrogenase
MANVVSAGRPFAVVTGASSGIGFELARQFAQHGYDLLVVSSNERIENAAQQIHGEYSGVQVEPLQSNLATYDGVEKLCGKIQSMGRPLDVIALNAGVGVGGDFARETDLKDEMNLINLNVISTVHLTKRALKMMLPQGHGRILFTSSIAATMAGSYEAVYSASKAFIQSFAEGIRNELKNANITVTSLMPGATETEFFERAGMEDTRVGSGKKDSAALVAKQGYDALMAGKDHIVAGSFKNKVMATAAKLLPHKVSAQAHRFMSKPGTGKSKTSRKKAA